MWFHDSLRCCSCGKHVAAIHMCRLKEPHTSRQSILETRRALLAVCAEAGLHSPALENAEVCAILSSSHACVAL